jgi:integrin alpha 8
MSWQGLFKHWRIIDGLGHRGRFGFAAANLGDLNSDGLQDFAVSAPYDGEDLQGKVFVFLGRQDNDAEYRPARVLTPSSLPMKVKSFGFALHGERVAASGVAKDPPRLVIGAPLSDSVFVASYQTLLVDHFKPLLGL